MFFLNINNRKTASFYYYLKIFYENHYIIYILL